MRPIVADLDRRRDAGLAGVNAKRGRDPGMRHNRSWDGMRASPGRLGQARGTEMIGSRFSPEPRRALRIDISATLLFTVFAALTAPCLGRILRPDLGATTLQLAVMSSACGACLLLSLLWARVSHGRPPLPYLVWPAFAARGVFLLVPFASSAWSFVGLVIARDFFSAAVAPAHAAVVERVYPRAQRARALGLVRMAGALLGIWVALPACPIFYRVCFLLLFVTAGPLC